MQLPTPQSFPSLAGIDPADTLVDACSVTLHDAGTRPRNEPAPAPMTADDARWSIRLVGLLGRLEVHREQLRAVATAGNHVSALPIAANLVGNLLTFDGSPEDPEAVRAAVRFVTAARTIAQDVGRSRFFGFKRAVIGPAEQEQCAWVLRDLIGVLESYFGLLADRFRSPLARREWIAMATEFNASVLVLLRAIDETV